MTPDAMAGGMIIVVALIIVVLPVLPFFWVLKKMGRTPWWGVLLFVPLVNVVMYWVFAFWRWPSVDGYRYSALEFD